MFLTVKHYLQYHWATHIEINTAVEFMTDFRVFTIGHGGRSIDEIVTQLKDQGIKFVVDVRSQPYSKYQPDFSRNTLAQHLAKANLHYIFMGEQLGGRPQDPTCYTENGNVDYGECRQRNFFQEGISRLLTACERGFSLALLCSEGNPANCHRSALIGNELYDRGVQVFHLMPDGSQKFQSEIMQQRTSGKIPLPGFDLVSSKRVAERKELG